MNTAVTIQAAAHIGTAEVAALTAAKFRGAEGNGIDSFPSRFVRNFVCIADSLDMCKPKFTKVHAGDKELI